MISNKNVFCATNPARMADALWKIITDSGVELSKMLIFLPSRRAVRTVEKMLVDKSGHAIILPRLVALGEAADDDAPEDDMDENNADALGNMERVVAVAQLLHMAGQELGVANMDAALTVAHDLVRMTDYLENEGVDASAVDWMSLVDDKYATHFQAKARLLNIISDFLPKYAAGRLTTTAVRNMGIRDWIKQLHKYKLVIVCASTASVPATADLMVAVAGLDYGRIILSGKISGRDADFQLPTNPYNAEYKFLTRIGSGVQDVIPIDVGESAIDFFNVAFGNDCTQKADAGAIKNCHLVLCGRESEEAAAAAEIAARSVAAGKSVLIITPDAAGNQRLATALAERGINADFSGGVPGTMTAAGRAILNQFDRWIDSESDEFNCRYAAAGRNLLNTIVSVVDEPGAVFTPEFNVADDGAVQVWNAIAQLSECLVKTQFVLNVQDARALVADAIASVKVRAKMNPDANVVVLGTIESRMQTADVVILSGLNDGMFPARGYDNNWLPRAIAMEIGLPSPDRKVSLMALDFMNLSCGAEVYWLRCKISGGAEKTESRFLSRVAVAGGRYDAENGKEIPPYDMDCGAEIIKAVRARDVVDEIRMDYSAPQPPADWSDVYVTKLEYLIHNPYAFYANHILGLYPKNDEWEFPSAAEFGTLVHDTIEKCARDKNLSAATLISALDEGAREKLGQGNILFDFWHRRFVEFADIVVAELKKYPDIKFEVPGKVNIYLDAEKQSCRTVRARADGVWGGGVLDIKTGRIPTDTQLKEGTMPQLPLEALMFQQGGFGVEFHPVENPEMKFVRLQRKNVGVVDVARQMRGKKNDAGEYPQIDIIRAAVDKVAELFRIYSAGNAPYVYRETREDDYKSHQFDDLARVGD